MVKVCNFSFFKEQKIISPNAGEPLAITCSNEFLFVAEEGCVLEVYPLSGTEPIAQLRTVSPVVQLLYNDCGDCIVTLERKSPVSRSFARVYFKWRGSSIDRPMRVSLIGSLTQGLLHGAQSQHVATEIVELPADETSSITCLSCCPDSGRVAVGMDTKIRVFSLGSAHEDRQTTVSDPKTKPDSLPPRKVVSSNIEILLDVQTGMRVKKLDIFNDYVAFISATEARVLKLSFLGDSVMLSGECGLDSRASSTTAGYESDVGSGTPTDHPQAKQPRIQLIDREKETKIKNYSNFFSWSPSKVWESERLSASLSMSTGNESSDSLSRSHDPEPHPLYTNTSLHVHPSPSPYVETLALPSITEATQQKTSDRHPIEVLGPVEYVWGQPVEVELEDGESGTTPTRCRVLTMLYRRFPATQFDSAPLSQRSATMSLPVRGGRGFKQEGEEGGLHSVELVPTRVQDSQTVIGLSCFIGSRFHGYLYDVAVKTRLISSLSFMSQTRAVSTDSCFIHALSDGSIETFSNRAMQAALLNKPVTAWSESPHTQWLKQPCPNPSMDLTLMSSNKFIGGCCLATSGDHMVVLTKSSDSQQQQPTGNWLLQSLSVRRVVSEPTWNIYILTMKDPLSLYQQLVEYSDSLKGTSPPMYQHVISEGHVLLRSQLLQNLCLSESVRGELSESLSENCFALADSLCAFTRGPKAMVTNAAKYFILSGAPLAKVVQHITSAYSRVSPDTQGTSPPYTVLMKYLSLVLAGGECGDQLAPLANTILDLYAEFKPKQLGQLLLSSPLRELSPEHALSLLSKYLRSVPKSYDSLQDDLCQVLLFLQTNREEEAVEKLNQVPEDPLIGWLNDNMLFVLNSEKTQLSKLGKILWIHRESSLLRILYDSLTTKQLEFTFICGLIESQQLADNTLLKGFLEKIILDHPKETIPTVSHKAILLLVEVLLARLCSPNSPRPSPSSPFSLYGNRHKWLDSLPPFDGSMDSAPPSQTALQDLMQLQALLCSQYMFPMTQVASHTETLMEGCGHNLIGSLSLKLLTWPHAGKIKQATLLALQEAPLVTIDYELSYLPPLLSSWKDLLSLLEDHIQRSGQEELVWPTDTYEDLYKAALEHVVTMTTPDEFLSLLPSSGSLAFFLPFIESSCRLYLASQVAGQLHANCLT